MDMDFKVSKGLLVKMVLSKLAPLASMVMKNGPKKNRKNYDTFHQREGKNLYTFPITGNQFKENTIHAIRARESMGFPWDVPRATPSGHPSENPYSPSLEWHVHYIHRELVYKLKRILYIPSKLGRL